MSWFGAFSSLIGFWILALRLLPALRISNRNEPARSGDSSEEHVSIVVPARDEESNLPGLLESLIELDWNDLEIIVVDDESTDRTSEVVSGFAALHPERTIRLVRGEPRPKGWTGKNWACHQGFLVSNGKFVLFTDADTRHDPDSLRRAVSRMRGEELDLLSAVPFHRSETLWEKLMGPFQLMMFISTAAFSRPRIGRVFAIGQYLLFDREAYARQGGHEAIRETLCDDLELAHHCMSRGGRYRVDGTGRLFTVRMYDSFLSFVRGWRRIFRLGFRHARAASAVEMYFVVAVLTANMKFFAADLWALLAAGAALLLFGAAQRRFGEFSALGILLFPLSLAVFIAISALASVDLVFGREYSWRGRSYRQVAE